MIRLMLILALFLVGLELPRPHGQWKISYLPETVMLKSSGESWFFYREQVYIYDVDGNLLRNFSLTFSPKIAFTGPNDTVFVHDGSGLLGRVNQNENLQWQREMPSPSVSPRLLGDDLVYADENRIQILDAADGTAKFSLHRGHPVIPVATSEAMVLFAGAGGSLVAWDPLNEVEQLLFSLSGRPDALLRFFRAAPNGEWALVYDDGRLIVLRENRRVRWQRDLHIEVSTPPVWLKAREKWHLLVASHARTLTVYGERGEQLSRKLMDSRPRALIAWDQDLALLVPNYGSELVWYRSEEGRFSEEILENSQILVLESGPFVLLVGEDGIIRLYRRGSPFHNQ